jgi:hypothetical protein
MSRPQKFVVPVGILGRSRDNRMGTQLYSGANSFARRIAPMRRSLFFFRQAEPASGGPGSLINNVLVASRLWRRGCQRRAGARRSRSERPAYGVLIRLDCTHVVAPRRRS